MYERQEEIEVMKAVSAWEARRPHASRFVLDTVVPLRILDTIVRNRYGRNWGEALKHSNVASDYRYGLGDGDLES